MLLEHKGTIDKFVVNNWNETPVQIDGARFDAPDDRIWISIVLEQNYREEETFGRCVLKNGGLLKIFSYSTSATESYLLAKRVTDLLDEIFIGPVFVGAGTPDGRGAIPLHNGIYETLMIFKVDEIETKV